MIMAATAKSSNISMLAVLLRLPSNSRYKAAGPTECRNVDAPGDLGSLSRSMPCASHATDDLPEIPTAVIATIAQLPLLACADGEPRQTLQVQFDRTPLSAILSDLLVDRLGEILIVDGDTDAGSPESSQSTWATEDRRAVGRTRAQAENRSPHVSLSDTPTISRITPLQLNVSTHPQRSSAVQTKSKAVPARCGTGRMPSPNAHSPRESGPRQVFVAARGTRKEFQSWRLGLIQDRGPSTSTITKPRQAETTWGLSNDVQDGRRHWASTSNLVSAGKSPFLGRRRSRSDADIGATPLVWQATPDEDPFVTPKTARSTPARGAGVSPLKPPRNFDIDFSPATMDRSLSDIVRLRRRISKADLQRLVGDAIQRQKGSALQMFGEADLIEIREEYTKLERSLVALGTSHEKAVRRRHRFQLLLHGSLEDGDLAIAQRAAGTLARITEHCDRLVQELHWARDKLHQLRLMEQVHACSAASLALGKLNSAYLRELREKQSRDVTDLHTQTMISAPLAADDLDNPMEVLRSPAVEHEPTSAAKDASNARLSSMSIASLTKLSFPVPPARCRLELPCEFPTPVVIRLEADYTPSTSRRRAAQRSASVDILILPPGHQGAGDSSEEQGLPSSAALPLTPFRENRERRASLSLDAQQASYESANTSTASSLFFRAAERRQSTPLPNLDLSQSIKRARRGRQTAVEGPESILMALATASWWTNPDLRDAFEEGLAQ